MGSLLHMNEQVLFLSLDSEKLSATKKQCQGIEALSSISAHEPGEGSSTTNLILRDRINHQNRSEMTDGSCLLLWTFGPLSLV